MTNGESEGGERLGLGQLHDFEPDRLDGVDRARKG